MKNGFTLTEVLITVGIIAALSAIAVPKYTKYRLRALRSEALPASVWSSSFSGSR